MHGALGREYGYGMDMLYYAMQCTPQRTGTEHNCVATNQAKLKGVKSTADTASSRYI
jgi:hypothetical protein